MIVSLRQTELSVAVDLFFGLDAFNERLHADLFRMRRVKSANIHARCTLVFLGDLWILKLVDKCSEGLLRRSLLLHGIEHLLDAFPEITFPDSVLVRAERLAFDLNCSNALA